jgi:hypothetical protein
MKKLTHITQQAAFAAGLAAAGLGLLMVMHVAAEPQISHSQSDTADFTVRQTVTAESSFLVPPTNVTMDGSINGITGGQATGSSQFVVLTNNTAGFRVDISFEDNGSANAMIGDANGNLALRNYDGDVGGQPSSGYSASTTAALFAYSVVSTSTADTAQSFLEDAGVCNVALGSGGTDGVSCWKSPAVAPFTIVRREAAATTGATSTVLFNVTVPNSANPTPEAQTYTATATLSLFNL